MRAIVSLLERHPEMRSFEDLIAGKIASREDFEMVERVFRDPNAHVDPLGHVSLWLGDDAESV